MDNHGTIEVPRVEFWAWRIRRPDGFRWVMHDEPRLTLMDPTESIVEQHRIVLEYREGAWKTL